MERPVVTLTGATGSSRYFDEAIVQGEIVSNRILPPLLIVTEIRELVHDELVDFVEREHSVLGVLNRHGDQRNVRIRRFDVSEPSPSRRAFDGRHHRRIRRQVNRRCDRLQSPSRQEKSRNISPSTPQKPAAKSCIVEALFPCT